MKTVLLHDQPLSGNGNRGTGAKRFGRGRITGLALIALLTLALGYLHFSGGSKSVSVPVGRASRPVDARALQLHDRGRQLRRGLRDARRAREPPRSELAPDRTPGHADSCPLGTARRPDLPPPGRPRHHEHGVPGREPLHRHARRRARRLPRRRRIEPARLPGGELVAGALARPSRRAVAPRRRRGVPVVRRSASRRRCRSGRLLHPRTRRRPRARPSRPRIPPDRPGQRKRRHPHGDDLRLALPGEHPPLGDDRRQPPGQLPLGREDNRRADPSLRGDLRPGHELSQPDTGPRRVAEVLVRSRSRSLAVPADQERRRQGCGVLRPDQRDLRRRRPDRLAADDRHASSRPTRATRAVRGSCR